jgi:hypothetical protein
VAFDARLLEGFCLLRLERFREVVGVLDPPGVLKPDPSDGVEVFEVPLSFFLDPGNVRKEPREFKGRLSHFYVWPYPGYYIWGATAGMLMNLSEVLRPDAMRR